MGTRAVIRFEGKPVFATHFDGYPEGLGKELADAKPKSSADIFRVAKKHQIDASDPKFAKQIDERNARLISKRDKIPYAKVKKAFARGKGIGRVVWTPENYPAGNIKQYNDWAEYEYDVDKNGNVKVRELRGGWYKDTRKADIDFKNLEEVI